MLSFWKLAKGTAKVWLIAEALCFAASYGVYYRMNTNREFRQYINENFPWALDYFYKVGEVLGNSNQRQIDATVWRAESEKRD